MNNVFISRSIDETKKIAQNIAKNLKSGDVICLYGELGAGKTAFVKALAKELGVKDRIISPTFNLIRQHSANYRSIQKIYHVDLYRLDNISQIKNLGIEELFTENNSIMVVEWADKMSEILPEKRIDIIFELDSSENRKITVKNYEDNITKTIEVLRNGGIVIFPTDTVFGIGCRIDDEDTVKRLFNVRKRPESKPTPVLVSSIEMVNDFVDNIPSGVNKLINRYWPGGLTIVFPSAQKNVSPLVKGGADTLGVRMPNYPDLLSVIEKLNIPIIGSSANFSGEKTPYKKEDLDPSLVNLVDYVMEGDAGGNQSSTVIDCTQKPWKILREGAVEVDPHFLK